MKLNENLDKFTMNNHKSFLQNANDKTKWLKRIVTGNFQVPSQVCLVKSSSFCNVRNFKFLCSKTTESSIVKQERTASLDAKIRFGGVSNWTGQTGKVPPPCLPLRKLRTRLNRLTRYCQIDAL